jgi:hypothetical protein
MAMDRREPRTSAFEKTLSQATFNKILCNLEMHVIWVEGRMNTTEQAAFLQVLDNHVVFREWMEMYGYQ